MNTSEAIDDTKSPQTDRELALRLEIEDIRARYRNYLYFGLFGIFLAALVATYAIDVYNNSKSSLERNYKEIEELITSAYRADPQAHEEVVRRFPILLKGRLPRKLKRLQAEPIVEQSFADNPNLKSANVTENTIFPSAPRPTLKVYADKSRNAKVLGTVNAVSDIQATNRNGNWTSIQLTAGLPVWISAAYATELKPSLIEVSGSRVGLRSEPEQSKEYIVGIVDRKDQLSVISKRGDWYQVRTPDTLEVWAMSDDLDRFTAIAPGRIAQRAEQPTLSQAAVEETPKVVSQPKPPTAEPSPAFQDSVLETVEAPVASSPEVENSSLEAVEEPIAASIEIEDSILVKQEAPVASPAISAEKIQAAAAPAKPRPKSVAATSRPTAAQAAQFANNATPGKLKLYSHYSQNLNFLRNVSEPSEIVANTQYGEWSSVSLATAIPVWIAAKHVVEEKPSLIRVVARNVGLRVEPEEAREAIVGLVFSRQNLDVIGKMDDWYQVWAPADFRGWVITDELERFVGSTQTQPDQQDTFETDTDNVPKTTGDSRLRLQSTIIPTETGALSPKLKLYTERSEQSVMLGAIRDDSEIIAIKRRGDWSSIMLSTGIPVWVSTAYATQLGPSLVKVTAPDVGLRIRPESSREFIVATVETDDTLQLLGKQGAWYKVNTPADFRSWVKTDDLDRLMQ